MPRPVQLEARRADLPTAALAEIAHVERLLRADARAVEPVVDVGDTGARLSFRTAEHNAHARGSLTADAVNEVVATDAWGVATIHDPVEREDGAVISTLTVVYAPETDSGDSEGDR
jgi:hypothetical protein